MAKSPEKPPLAIVSGDTAGPIPPRPLGQHGAALWRKVQSEYTITDCGGAEILAQICAAQDRVEALRERIDADGETVHTRGGMPRAHPALRDELQLRSFIVKSLEKLGLNVEAVKPPGRPPGGGLGWIPGR
jgi:P27 family predicted phage terminase small subunit